MKGGRRKGIGSFRDLGTLQTLVHRRAVAERHELAARYARLENERARLERELAMWDTRKRATKDALHKIIEQIAVLRPCLLKQSAKRAIPRKARGRYRARATTDVSGTGTLRARVIPLEY